MTTTTELAVIFLLLLAAAATSVTAGRAKTRTPSPPLPEEPAPSPPRKSAPRPPRSPPSGPANCSDELVAFSKCLPYISSSPNNATNSPSSKCCKDVAYAFTSGSAVCFCYLVQKPSFFGFPLNSSRILSLTSLCPMKDHGTKANFSLSSLCSRIHSLPPLKSITGPEHTKPSISEPRIPGDLRNAPDQSPPPPPTVNFTQESTADSDTPPPSDDSHSVPKFQNISEARPYVINGISDSTANLAGFSLSSWLLSMSLFMFSMN